MKYFHLLYVENVWMIFAQFQLPNCGMGSLWLIGKVGPRPINHKLNILQFSNEKISTIIRIFHTLISCIENTFERYICWKMSNLSDIHSFIGSYFIHQHIYLCVKRVFNAWHLCIKCMNVWMNKLHTIFIINFLHFKFVTIPPSHVAFGTTYATWHLGLKPCHVSHTLWKAMFFKTTLLPCN